MSKRITEQRLYNSALYYLERYDASLDKVRRVLYRKAQRAQQTGVEIPSELPTWIEHILERLQQQGFVSDTRYAENQIRILTQAGKSERFIRGKLRQAGISDETVSTLLQSAEGTELSRACLFVRKKKLGPWRAPTERSDKQKKDLAVLARAGFSYDVARQALNLSSDARDEMGYDESFSLAVEK